MTRLASPQREESAHEVVVRMASKKLKLLLFYSRVESMIHVCGEDQRVILVGIYSNRLTIECVDANETAMQRMNLE
jgi:hypothetical protein